MIIYTLVAVNGLKLKVLIYELCTDEGKKNVTNFFKNILNISILLQLMTISHAKLK